MFCCSSIPVGSQGIILLDAKALFVMSAQFNLGVGIATFGSLFKPLEGFVVFADSRTDNLLVSDGQRKLRLGDTLLSSALHAFFALSGITIGMLEADGILSRGVVLFGR